MSAVQAIKHQDINYSVEDAMDVLFNKLDVAIDDMENNRVQSIEDVWTEVDAI